MSRIPVSIAGLPHQLLARIAARMRPRRRGRPWAQSLNTRLVMASIALRTNLTIRELAALFGVSKSQAHRVIDDMTRRISRLFERSVDLDRRRSWIVDGTLVPTRDHSRAAKSKNYRWSCNAQILARWRDRRVVAISGGGPGNRNDPIHYRGSSIEALCREHGRALADGGYRGIPHLRTPIFRKNKIVRDQKWRRHRRRRARIEHVIARLKNWRVLRDHRRRGSVFLDTLRAVALLHNLQAGAELRDIS